MEVKNHCQSHESMDEIQLSEKSWKLPIEQICIEDKREVSQSNEGNLYDAKNRRYKRAEGR